MIFKPRWPSAGPTGGLGFAFPAGICNFIKPITFFATKTLLFDINSAWVTAAWMADQIAPFMFTVRRELFVAFDSARMGELLLIKWKAFAAETRVHGNFVDIDLSAIRTRPRNLFFDGAFFTHILGI